MKVLDSMMQDRISIFRPADDTAAVFDPDTLVVTEGAGVVLYNGEAMIGPVGAPIDSAENGYPSMTLGYKCRFPLSKKVVPLRKGDLVTIIRADRSEIRWMVGFTFYIEGEVIGSYSASRSIMMTLRTADNA